jgi:hypothetical protein
MRASIPTLLHLGRGRILLLLLLLTVFVKQLPSYIFLRGCFTFSPESRTFSSAEFDHASIFHQSCATMESPPGPACKMHSAGYVTARKEVHIFHPRRERTRVFEWLACARYNHTCLETSTRNDWCYSTTAGESFDCCFRRDGRGVYSWRMILTKDCWYMWKDWGVWRYLVLLLGMVRNISMISISHGCARMLAEGYLLIQV